MFFNGLGTLEEHDEVEECDFCNKMGLCDLLVGNDDSFWICRECLAKKKEEASNNDTQ